MAANSPASGSGRSWAGTTKADRQAARHASLRAATMELIAEQGCAAVTVRSVCRRAQLTDRYFYESFSGRDELLSSLFLQYAGEIHESLTLAIDEAGSDLKQLIISMGTIFDEQILDHPAKGRLLLVEPLVEPALTGAGMAQVPAFTRLVKDQLPAGTSREDRAMSAVALAGALGALLSAYFTGTLKVSRKQLVDRCTTLLLGAYGTGR